jgi:hypothetical protein
MLEILAMKTTVMILTSLEEYVTNRRCKYLSHTSPALPVTMILPLQKQGGNLPQDQFEYCATCRIYHFTMDRKG